MNSNYVNSIVDPIEAAKVNNLEKNKQQIGAL